jgi:hypothetical protein
VEGSSSYSKMNKLGENDAGDADSDTEDPEQLLNEWLGELHTLTGVSLCISHGDSKDETTRSCFILRFLLSQHRTKRIH